MENIKKEGNYYTFGMIKPDGMEHKQEIIKLILDAGLKISYYKCAMLTDDLIDENYSHVKKKFPQDFNLLKESLKSGPVLMMLIYDQKGNAVENYRKVLGTTKSWEADPNSIRGKFGDKEKIYRNAAHGSGNVKEAGDEVIRFFGKEIFNVFDSLVWSAKYEEALLNAGYFNSDDFIKKYVDEQTIRLIDEACLNFKNKKGE